ncbi:MAG: hypothetical protein HOW73_35420 [Polyangiaceae bacterium]|nr:hypothetical protein [Polyangiaceae bacterium]
MVIRDFTRHSPKSALLALTLGAFGCLALAGCAAGSEDDGEGGSSGNVQPGPQFADAGGVTIREVAVYQAVKSDVFLNGAAQSPSTPIVAERPAVVRVFVDVGEVTGGAITARLTVGENDPIDVPVDTLVTSTEEDIASTINFDIPAGLLAVGDSIGVELLEPADSSPGDNAGSKTGAIDVQAQRSNVLKITIIPIRYNADGSGRVPDTSDATLESYRKLFLKIYPATDVQVTLGDTFDWGQQVAYDGFGWDVLLNALGDKRAGSGAGFDEFYYGIFDPESSVQQYCSPGWCVLGLGFVGDPGATYSRAAIGVGFAGEESVWSAVHEVGHNHGLLHSPCGVQDADPNYPYAGGETAVWGMDILDHELYPPTYKDLMGYCTPNWISDYVYEAMLDFRQAIDMQAKKTSASGAPTLEYERVSFGARGPQFLSSLKTDKAVGGETVDVTTVDDSGAEHLVKGQFLHYDHIDGGVLLVARQSGEPRLRTLRARVVSEGVERVLEARR